jgi:hypothetical protein
MSSENTHSFNPTPSMKPIAVLANQVLQNAPILQLDERHVRLRRNSTQGIRVRGARPALRFERPVPIWATEVGDSWRVVSSLVQMSSERVSPHLPTSRSQLR